MSKYSTKEDTSSTRQLFGVFQALNSIFIKFASNNFSLSFHKSSKVYSFVSRGSTRINNL